MADPFVLVPAPDPMIGRVVDRFVVMTSLGRGGMGAVYLAQHEGSPHVRCVIKTMLAHVANNAMMIARFKIETDAVSRLKHDNIVKLENFGVLDDGQMFMRFEYIAGQPLDRYLAEHGGRLSLHRAAYLAFQVCDALDHAHAVGVVHRDLKPDNLLIVVDHAARVPQLVKVVDFGISKIVRVGEIQTGSGMSMGTPYFMAVEQYANAAEATARADVFSLGVILWLMVTGELPWGRPDPGVLYHLQRTVVPTRPPEDVMPSAVAKILLRCFAVEPDDRPTMRELAVALASAIPATERAPSGSEILLDLVPRWVLSAPDDAQTVRHGLAVPERIAAQLWPQLETDAARRNRRLPAWDANLRSALPKAQALVSASAVVPEFQRQALAPAPAPMPSDAPAAPHAPVSPATLQERRRRPIGPVAAPPSQHLIAALPTGKTSAEFAGTHTPPHEPVPSLVAASEFLVLPAGTTGPQPYAHAELPPVVLSTQLSQLSQPASPSSAKPRLGKVVLLAATVGLLAATASFALVHLGSRSKPGVGSNDLLPPERRAADSPARSIDTGGVAVAETNAGLAPAGPSPAVAPSPHTAVDAGSPSAPVAVGVASPPEPHTIAENVARQSSPVDAGIVASAPDGQTARATRTLPTKPRTAVPASQTTLAAPPSAQEDGELVISVRPWAAIWLNGRSIPDGTPYRAKLRAGRYRLRLVNEDVGQSENLTVTVEPRKTATVERKWQ